MAHLFIRMTAVVAIAIIALVVLLAVLKIVVVAAVIAAVILGALFLYNFLTGARRSRLPVIR